MALPIPAILSGIQVALPLIRSALDVLGAFKGSAAQANTNGKVQDALGIVGALTPLLQNFGQGQEVTPDQVRDALANMDDALADLDAEIALQEDADDAA